MAVFYEELAGSPTVKMDRRGGSAQRIARIAWEDLSAFFTELFPDPYLGYLGAASFPTYPWLKVTSANAVPFDPERPSGLGEPLNAYPSGWRVTVDYTSPAEDRGLQGGTAGDHSGPGGGTGSTGGQQGQDQTFLTHKVTLGGEFLTWPSACLQWLLPAGTGGADEQYKLKGDVTMGLVVPTVEHHITWHFVRWPPWTAIRQCIGKVNGYAFAGAPPGTLLFLGAEASQDFTQAGAKAWSLTYKFSEKNQNPLNPLQPQGWNYFLRPDGPAAGTFQPVIRRVMPRKLSTPGIEFGTPSTVLSADASAAGAIIHVNSAADFPVQQFRIVVEPGADREEMAVISGFNGVNWTVIRGLGGTKKRDHPLGAAVWLYNGRVYDLCNMRPLFGLGVPL